MPPKAQPRGRGSDGTPIALHGETNYDAEELAGRKGKKRTSYIWKYGFTIVHASHATLQSENSSYPKQ